MQMQIENITSCYDVNDITVVVGFKKNLIMESFPELNYVYNSEFDVTNTSKSLLRALEKSRGNSVLWFNGDVVFDEVLLKTLNPYIQRNESFVSVNTERVAEEEVKYTLDGEFINEISKTVVGGLGEAVGINFISADDIDYFIERLKECEAQDYFERGLELAIVKDALKVRAIDISQHSCIEVDFLGDLESVNEIFTD